MTTWIAYHCDWSGFALFETEIEALRYAVDNQMHVKGVSLPCESPRDAAAVDPSAPSTGKPSTREGKL